jgi:hypothetical protein
MVMMYANSKGVYFTPGTLMVFGMSPQTVEHGVHVRISGSGTEVGVSPGGWGRNEA